MDKNFSSSPYGEGSFKRSDGQDMLSAALRGFLGKEESGSVLDPRTAGLKSVNDKASLASILSDLVPPKALGAGVVVPILRGFNKDKTAAAWLENQARRASDMSAAGALPGEITALTGLYKMPGSYPGINNPRQAQWMHNVELDPTKPVWHPNVVDESGFMERDQGQRPLKELLRLKANSVGPGAYEDFARQYPQLLDIKALATKAEDKTAKGRYQPQSDSFTVYGNADDPLKTFNHELSHGVMNRTKQYQVGGFGMHPIDLQEGIMQGYDLANQLKLAGVHPDIVAHTRKTLNMANDPDAKRAFNNGWARSPGEELANFSAALDKASLERTPKPYMPNMQNRISDSIPRALGDSLWYLSQGHDLKPVDQVYKVYMKQLRERNLLE